MKVLFAIAAGGALGAIGRYVAISAIGQLFGSGFPYGTIVVNVFGSFALGTLIEGMTLIWSPNNEFRAFLIVGLLGSFTTFSAFSLDVVTLINFILFIESPSDYQFWAGDVNTDDTLNVLDVVIMVDIILE